LGITFVMWWIRPHLSSCICFITILTSSTGSATVRGSGRCSHRPAVLNLDNNSRAADSGVGEVAMAEITATPSSARPDGATAPWTIRWMFELLTPPDNF
jgi:hypothetical protein